MLRRIAQHYAGIQKDTEKKYRIMSEARRKGHNITSDVLYYANGRRYAEKMAEIGEKEGEYIRRYRPILNAQIPKDSDWTKWDLTGLGKVVKVEFNLEAGDKGYGEYGLVIPGYFAYDDIAVQF